MNVENHAAAGVDVLGVVQRGTGQHFIELGNVGIVPWGKYGNRPEKEKNLKK
jgi:hypothetical protein